MSLHFNPIWPYATVLATAVGLVLLVLVTYPPRVRHLAPWTRRLMIGLRLAAAVVLALAMLRPELRRPLDDDQDRTILVLGDASRSMQTRDGAGGASRREELVRTMAGSADLLERLKEKYEVRLFDFADGLRAVDKFDEESEGAQTALGLAMTEALQDADRSRLAAVFLLSDGAHRALPPDDLAPRDAAQRIAESPTGHVPVSTVVFGSAALEGAVDVAVEDFSVAEELFARTTVPVDGRIRATGVAGQPLVVRLLLEDRSGKQPGETGELVPVAGTADSQPVMRVTPRDNDEMIDFKLTFTPQTPGEYKLAVLVEPVEGELKVNNNQKSTIVRISKGGLRVAYFDKPYWEQKYIRLAGQPGKMEIDFIAVRPQPFGKQAPVDPQLFLPSETLAYDAYIIGDVPREVFGDENLRNLAARVRDGAGLLMLGGFNTLGPGGYAGSPIEPLLPVDLRDDTGAAHHLKDLPMLPTREGLRHFIMRLAAVGDNAAKWRELPPLQSGNRLFEKNAAVEVLAATDPDYPRAGIPLLFSHDAGRARVMTFAGDTTWQWVTHGHKEAHQQFWRQMLLYLTRKEMDTDQSVWAVARPRTALPGEDVTIEYGARDAEGDPIEDAAFTMTVLRPEDEPPTENPPAQGGGERMAVDYRETETPGDYWVRVAATKDGESVGPDAWTRFVVEPHDLELDNPVADPDLLSEIASTTGGRAMRPEEFRGYLEDLLENPPQSLVESFETVRLWDNWWFLLAFVGLLTLEWTVRKGRGLV